ncbi:MAG: trypsin-like peptidase domain-containing protein, partial [Desulfatitalea sp.]|nr:trypsin-like peptidase domain-containing protein [Desulfatitalea sp.]
MPRLKRSSLFLKWTFTLIVAWAVVPHAGLADSPMETLRRSVVRIYTVAQTPDYTAPWDPGGSQEGWGSGFIISGQRILTNAHVVSNARFVTLEKENDARRYEARVKFIAHDCDLAMLEVVDPGFFQGTSALKLGDVPALDSMVTVLGYPIGGDRLSVTRGVVSRIDYRGYAHSGVDSHLVVQIDAAINPGNSGGPVIQDSQLVGVAFQG